MLRQIYLQKHTSSIRILQLLYMKKIKISIFAELLKRNMPNSMEVKCFMGMQNFHLTRLLMLFDNQEKAYKKTDLWDVISSEYAAYLQI